MPTNRVIVSNEDNTPPFAWAAISCGVASLVIGILSLFTCWLPFLGLIISGIAVFLGMIGFFLSLVSRGAGIGFAIGGLSVSVVSMVLCLLWTLVFSAMVASGSGGG